VLPRRTATSRTVDALFDPVDTGHALRPGELVRLTLTEAIAEPGFWLPLTALSTGERGLWQALVAVPTDADDTAGAGVDAGHRLEPRPVQVLELRDDHAYVSGPIAAGERVVTAGLQRVVAGQLVRVTPAGDGASPDARVADGPGSQAHLADTDPPGH
jgi:multidrug efflux pump subunit AcrA (membrane-fusion protein)